ncbi:MAG: hypothetical protein LBR29_01430, partial [Methylobacteriaceae bacterium]|nr:hypothetical protein [Methylobacteriaceae bacterium]
ESFEALRDLNDSRCSACGWPTLAQYHYTPRTTPGEMIWCNFSPDAVTLESYKQHVGRVVTFEGVVRDVKVSRRGTDFALMFENAAWIKGFKLVFFKSAVASLGGPDYLHSLKGKTLRVRGLIANVPVFGYEIIVTHKSMILDVR